MEPDELSRRQARGQKLILLGPGLLALNIAALSLRGFLINTDWQAMIGRELLYLSFIGLVLLPVTLALYALGYWIARSKFRTQAWGLGVLLPLLAAGVLVLDGLACRIFPGRLFHRFSGLDLPPSAQVVGFDYDGTVLEDGFSIRFTAPPPEIRELIRRFGREPEQDSGIECLDGVPVQGDYGLLEIDWDLGEVTFEYLDV